MATATAGSNSRDPCVNRLRYVAAAIAVPLTAAALCFRGADGQGLRVRARKSTEDESVLVIPRMYVHTGYAAALEHVDVAHVVFVSKLQIEPKLAKLLDGEVFEVPRHRVVTVFAHN